MQTHATSWARSMPPFCLSASRAASLFPLTVRATRNTELFDPSPTFHENMDKFRLPRESRLHEATRRHNEVLCPRERLARTLRVHEAVLIHQ